MYFIYIIRNKTNGKVYVGQTNNPLRRWASHKSSSENNQIQFVHRAIAKYGIVNFEFEIIATARTQGNIDFLEKEIIKQYNSTNDECGYNISPGGDLSWNRNLPPEMQPFYGKHHTAEAKQKISEALSGISKPHSKEWGQNISKALIGRKTPEDVKIKLKTRKNNAKLSWDLVNEIRVLLANQSLSIKEIALKYGVTPRAIVDIKNNKTWLIK